MSRILPYIFASLIVTSALVFASTSALAVEVLESPIVAQMEEGQQSGTDTVDHSIFDALLGEFVDAATGRVDYAGLKSAETRLDAYLALIAAVSMESLGRDEQLALLINAYNAYTLKLIVENYPGISSIRDLPDPWQDERYVVASHRFSLDQIEHGLIRPIFRDPRIHFAVNCAAVDCPPLRRQAYVGSRINEQLEAATVDVLRSERFVRVKPAGLGLTSLFDWYERDFVDSSFEGNQASVTLYVARYATEEVQEFVIRFYGSPPVEFLEYDWSLNDIDRE